MDIAVVIKQTPDTEARIVPDSGNTKQIVSDGINFILNPYDEFALEEALTITESSGGEVICFAIGPESSEPAMRTALAMGAARGILITDPGAVDADIVTQGKILAAAIRTVNPGLVLCGREWIDVQEDALAAILGEFLDMPHVMNAARITLNGSQVTVNREVEGATFEITSPLPAVVSCQKGLNEPRYPTLIAIRKSKSKELKMMSSADLGLTSIVPASQIVALEAPPPRAQGKLVTGETDQLVAQSLRWLSDEAKLI